MRGVLLVPSSSPKLSPIYDGLHVNVTHNITWFHLNHDTVSRRIYKLSCGQRVVVRCLFGSVWGGGLGPCGWRGQGQENREVHLVFVVFGCRKHRFTLSSRCVLSSCLWFLTLTLHCQMANEVIIIRRRERKGISGAYWRVCHQNGMPRGFPTVYSSTTNDFRYTHRSTDYRPITTRSTPGRGCHVPLCWGPLCPTSCSLLFE